MSISDAISSLALIVSFYALWVSKFQGPDLILRSTGRIYLSKNPNSPGLAQAALTFPFMLTNEGARTGYLLDFAVKVTQIHVNSGVTQTFRSLYEQLDDQLNMTASVLPSKSAQFSGIAVNPGETLVRRAFMVPVERSATFSWAIGKYRVAPYVRDQSSDSWRQCAAVTVDVGAGEIAEMNKSTFLATSPTSQDVSLMVAQVTTVEIEDAIKRLEKLQSS